MHVSPFTVKTHAVRAITKVGARDRAQRVSFTFRADTSTPEQSGLAQFSPSIALSGVGADVVIERASDRIGRTNGTVATVSASRWSAAGHMGAVD